MMLHEYCEFAAQRLRIRRRGWMTRYRYTRRRWHVLFAIVDLVGWCVFGPLKLLRFCLLLRSSRKEPRSILIVQLDHLGDAVMSLGLLRCLRQHHPAARLEVICGPGNQELFDAVREVDQAHVMRVTRFSRQFGLAWLVELLRWGWRLRRRKFDLAIDVRGEFPHAVLMWLAGARRRLGWASGGGGFLLTDRLWHVRGRHEVLSRRDILSALRIPASESAAPRFDLDWASLRWVGEQVVWSGHSVPRSRSRSDRTTQAAPLIVLHIGAGTQAKRWPTEHWQELIGRLTVEFDARIVLVGQEDCALGEQMRQSLLNVQDWTGKLSLAQLAALLQRANLFVGGDSGPAHLAAAVGTPVVALFSGTNDPEQWKPWGPRVAVVRHVPACSPCHKSKCRWVDHPCMHRLRPEAVMEPIRRFLTTQFPQFPLPASWKERTHGHSNESAVA